MPGLVHSPAAAGGGGSTATAAAVGAAAVDAAFVMMKGLCGVVAPFSRYTWRSKTLPNQQPEKQSKS
eukprot:m.199212 g.199212  ORF g.199212 m.199212 type:complete len:67 (+) comp17680_c0_seq2:5841-6041(+)